MFVGPYFDYDYAKGIMRMQHEQYMRVLCALAAEGLRFGLNAERVLGLESSEIGDFCIQPESFDHRVLQEMHDDIAAFFRFSHFRWPLFAVLEDPQDYIWKWHEFAVHEFRDLLHESAFARGFFDALRFSNKPRGMQGEDRMRQVLRLRYRAMFRRRFRSQV